MQKAIIGTAVGVLGLGGLVTSVAVSPDDRTVAVGQRSGAGGVVVAVGVVTAGTGVSAVSRACAARCRSASSAPS